MNAIPVFMEKPNDIGEKKKFREGKKLKYI